MSVNSDHSTFFHFLMLTGRGTGEEKGLSMQKLLHAQCTMGEGGLLQVQAGLIGYWFEQANKTKDTNGFLFSIPDSMWQPDFLRTVSWSVRAVLIRDVT